LWLATGRGLVHNEIPIDDRPVHTLQLWINMPRAAKMVDANFQELNRDRAPKRKLPGVEGIVFSGSSGNVVAPTRNHAKIAIVEVRLERGAAFEQELLADYSGFVVMLEGAGLIGADATPVRNGQLAWLQYHGDKSMVRFEAKDNGLRAILFSGQPLREPVV